MAAALADFWEFRGHVLDGSSRLDRALAADERPTPARAKALLAASQFATLRGDPETGRTRAEEALALYRKLGDDRGTANAKWGLGYALAEQGQWARARELLEQSVAGFEGLGDTTAVVWTTRTLAWICLELGERERGRKLHEENVERARAAGNARAEATILGALSMLAVEEGRLNDAFSMLRQNTPIFYDLRDPLALATNLVRVANALAAGNRPAAAATLLAHTAAAFEEIGARVPWVERACEETWALISDQLEQGETAAAIEEGRRLTADEAVAFAVAALE
jgi:tetratricopeptide (TPR) repeat protein